MALSSRERMARWRAANLDKARANCRQWRADNPDAANRWAKDNPDRLRALQKRWAKDNPERVREAKRRWKEANPEKLKEEYKRRYIADPEKAKAKTHRRRVRVAGAAGVYTSDDIAALHLKQGGVCATPGCGYSDELTVDHVVPVSQRGSNWPSNLQLLCGVCNSRKHSRDNDLFMAEALTRQFFSFLEAA